MHKQDTPCILQSWCHKTDHAGRGHSNVLSLLGVDMKRHTILISLARTHDFRLVISAPKVEMVHVTFAQGTRKKAYIYTCRHAHTYTIRTHIRVHAHTPTHTWTCRIKTDTRTQNVHAQAHVRANTHRHVPVAQKTTLMARVLMQLRLAWQK